MNDSILEDLDQDQTMSHEDEYATHNNKHGSEDQLRKLEDYTTVEKIILRLNCLCVCTNVVCLRFTIISLELLNGDCGIFFNLTEILNQFCL